MSGDKKICPTCHGDGYIMDSDGEQSAAIDCPTCDSQGELPKLVQVLREKLSSHYRKPTLRPTK